MPTKPMNAQQAMSAGFRAGHAARHKMVAKAGIAYIQGEEFVLSEKAGDEDPIAKDLPVSLQFQWVGGFERGYRTAAMGMPIPPEHQEAN